MTAAQETIKENTINPEGVERKQMYVDGRMQVLVVRKVGEEGSKTIYDILGKEEMPQARRSS